MSKNFPERDMRLRELMGELGHEMPETMAGFMKLHTGASRSGALDTKTKELISLAIGVTVRCDGCIAFHIKDALEAGASRREILEAVGVAILMGGGPSVVYATEALEALNQFEAQRDQPPVLEKAEGVTN